MTLEDKVTTYLHNEWVAGNEAKREAVGVAQGYMENIWSTIKENPSEGHTAEGLIKDGLVSYVDGYAYDQDLTNALEDIIKAHEGVA
jgi:hypothetical protein